MIKKLGFGLVLLAICFQLTAQTQQDTIYNFVTTTSVTIDGIADEACWNDADWYDISQVWMPYNATMNAGDFEGKFKTAWDGNYLYVLVEVLDDVLSDDHSDPLQNWWDDDCLEIFIDEDRSGGWHQNDENAFAYHLSVFYDAIDLGASDGVNYKEHVEVVMDTIAENTYLWEMAIKIYDDTYDGSSPEASRVTLTANKIMGFTIAYCDNDETTSRENFIGSIELPADKNNICYQDATYFGSMKLVEGSYEIPAAILVSDVVGKVSESGSEATFTLKLNKEPQSDVLINVSSDNTAEGSVSPGTLTFSTSNWGTEQSVTITGVDDDEIDGDKTFKVVLSVDGSSDSEFAALTDIEISIKNSDDDQASGTDLNIADKIGVRPNPATNYIFIDNFVNENLNCKIYSLSGSLVLDRSFNSHNNQLDISSLAPGTYSIRIIGESIQVQQLLIKL